MPTNLPPDYFAAQERYRVAQSTAEKIACLQEMLAIIPKHKGTEHLIGDLRRRLSKLKAAAQAPRKVGKRESAFSIDRAGAGQAVVVGPANVGKSALVAALTGVALEVGDYPYTTREPTPAMMPWEDIQIQLIDTPPLSADYVEPELRQLIRRADLIVLVVDVQTDPLQQLQETSELLLQWRIAPRQRRGLPSDTPNMLYVPFLVAANKCDDAQCDEFYEIFQALAEGWTSLPISAATGRNLAALKRAIFEGLEIIRVYTKVPGKEPDRQKPFVLPRGSTVADLAAKIHHDLLERLSVARVWGSGVFDGQSVGREHVLHDGDVVEIHT